jgi:hypothetical protein
MTPRYDKLKTFEGIKAGEYATTDMPNGILLHFFDIVIAAGNASGGAGAGGGRTLAETVDFLELRLNNAVQRQYTGAEIQAFNARNGSAFDVSTVGTGATLATYLRNFLNETFRRDPYLARSFGWNLNDNPGAPGSGNMQIAVKFNAACTAPSISGGYWYDPSQKPIGSIVKVRRMSQDAIGSERNYSKLLDLGSKAERLFSLHFFPTVGGTVRYVTELTLSYDGVDYAKQLGYLLNRFHLQKTEMVPDTAGTPRFDVEFDALDPLQDALPLRQGANQDCKVTWDGAANGNMIVVAQFSGPPE